MEEQEPKDPREALYPFITEARVQAFVDMYEPCDNEWDSNETLTTADLRKFFDAYVKTVGDPLSVYLDDYLIGRYHFRLVTSRLLREPVMYVRLKV